MHTNLLTKENHMLLYDGNCYNDIHMHHESGAPHYSYRVRLVKNFMLLVYCGISVSKSSNLERKAKHNFVTSAQNRLKVVHLVPGVKNTILPQLSGSAKGDGSAGESQLPAENTGFSNSEVIVTDNAPLVVEKYLHTTSSEVSGSSSLGDQSNRVSYMKQKSEELLLMIDDKGGFYTDIIT